MSTYKGNKLIGSLLLVFGLLVSTVGMAWHNDGHEGYRHHRGGYNHYHRPSFPYGGGGGFFYGGPEVIINLSPPRYVPVCHRIEVCNRFGTCWLEDVCD